MKKDIVCVRAFLKENLGDDLFLDILCNRYPKKKFVVCGSKKYSGSLAEIKNLEYKYDDSYMVKWTLRLLNFFSIIFNKICLCLWKRHLFSKVSLFDIWSSICQYNVLISGSLFIQRKITGKCYFPNIKSPYRRSEKKYYNRKPIVLGCNFGPYYDESYRQEYQELFLKAKQVSFREKYSADLFEGDNIYWASDIVFSYSKNKCILPDLKEYVLISVVNLNKDFDDKNKLAEEYLKYMIELVNKLKNANHKIVLLGCCNSQGDDIICYQILDGVRDNSNIRVVDYPNYDMHQMVGYFANAKYVVASRFHAMILGWLFEKNVFPIVYDDKMLHVIKDIEKRIGIDIKHTSIKNLDVNYIEYVLQHITDNFEWSEELRGIISDSNRHFELLDRLLK